MNRKPYLVLVRDRWYVETHTEEWRGGQVAIRRRLKSLGVAGRGNRRQAERALRALEAKRAQELRLVGGEMLVAEYFSRYLDSLRITVKQNSMIAYERAMEAFAAAHPGLYMSQMTASIADGWRQRLARRYSPNSVNTMTTPLRAAFARAVRERLIPHNPFATVPRVGVPPRGFPPFWTVPVFTDFLSGVASVRDRRLFTLGFYAGLRAQEAANLRWQDVGAELITIESRESFRTKSDKSRRVPILPGLRRELEGVPSEGAPSGDGSPGKRRGVHVLGDPPLTTQRIGQLMRDYARPFCERRGVRRLTYHGLRHSFATMLAPHVTIAMLSRLLGHAQIATTMIYTHIQDDDALRALGPLMDAAPPNTDGM